MDIIDMDAVLKRLVKGWRTHDPDKFWQFVDEHIEKESRAVLALVMESNQEYVEVISVLCDLDEQDKTLKQAIDASRSVTDDLEKQAEHNRQERSILQSAADNGRRTLNSTEEGSGQRDETALRQELREVQERNETLKQEGSNKDSEILVITQQRDDAIQERDDEVRRRNLT